jgi:hypothetical protein
MHVTLLDYEEVLSESIGFRYRMYYYSDVVSGLGINAAFSGSCKNYAFTTNRP